MENPHDMARTVSIHGVASARQCRAAKGRLRWLSLILLGQLLYLCSTGQALAATVPPAHPRSESEKITLASPTTALLSPAGGRVEVEERLTPQDSGADAARTLVFALPPDATNLQLSVPGQTIVRWSSTPVTLTESGALAIAREELMAERMRLAARLVAVKAAVALWQTAPESASAQDLVQRGQLITETVPGLALEQETLEKRLHLLQQRIERLPTGAQLGELVQVTLQKPVPAGEKLAVRYSYTWPHCGWNAVYDFNARPEEDRGVIDVRLMADVWQYSGIDWSGTKVTLATRGSGPREPAPLPEWVVDSQPRPQSRPVPMALNAMRSTKAMAEGSADAVPANAGMTTDTTSIYASWTLAETGLPEGRSRLQIAADVWKAPLQWLARPNRGDSRVWLFAKYDLPQGNTAWPEGTAEYSVDGQSVGSGIFRPRSDEITLYFGADPRVNVRTFDDTRKKGESGFIKTSKTWTWAWTYTVSNEHSKPVTVKLERPAPAVVNQGVTVTYKDEPPAQKNEQKHMLFWNVEVPSHDKVSVKHSVIIASPEKVQLFPDVP